MSDFYAGQSVIVTGGLGLIGSFLSETLHAAGARVIIVDDESKGSWRYIGDLKSKVEYRKVDLTQRDLAIGAISGADYVFHLASRAYGVGYSSQHNFEMFRFNDLLNTNVLDAIAASRPRQALVVSSSCVYSDDGPTPMSDGYPITGDPEKVNWGYGWAKRVLELKAAIYQRETGAPITVVRPFNIYGEHYNWCGQDSQAIPMLVKRVLDRESPIVVWGSGNQRRNYIHAEDCARCMLKLVENGFADRPVNIGREETVSVRGLVERIASVADVEIDFVCDRTKPEGRFIKSGDSRLLYAALGEGFEWKIDLTEGLERMVGWYRETFVQDASDYAKDKSRIYSP